MSSRPAPPPVVNRALHGLALSVALVMFGPLAVAVLLDSGSVGFKLTGLVVVLGLGGSTHGLVVLCLRRQLPNRRFTLAKLLVGAAGWGALNALLCAGLFVVVLLLFPNPQEENEVGAMVLIGIAFGAVLGVVVGAIMHLPLVFLRRLVDRPVLHPGPTVFLIVSGAFAAMSLLPGLVAIRFAGWSFLALAVAPWLIATIAFYRRYRLVVLEEGRSPDFERVEATPDMPDDLLPVHAGVSASPRCVLIKVVETHEGPFREAPARIAYARVDG